MPGVLDLVLGQVQEGSYPVLYTAYPLNAPYINSLSLPSLQARLRSSFKAEVLNRTDGSKTSARPAGRFERRDLFTSCSLQASDGAISGQAT